MQCVCVREVGALQCLCIVGVSVCFGRLSACLIAFLSVMSSLCSVLGDAE